MLMGNDESQQIVFARRVFHKFNSMPSYVINVGMLDVYIAKHKLSRYSFSCSILIEIRNATSKCVDIGKK